MDVLLAFISAAIPINIVTLQLVKQEEYES